VALRKFVSGIYKLAFIVKKDRQQINMIFLLHKDKEENKEIATAQMAHLVFADTQANASKNQKSHFLPTLHRQTII